MPEKPSNPPADDSITTSFEEWKSWLKEYSAIPLEISWQSTLFPVSWKPFWVEGQPGVLLETGGEPQAADAQSNYTILGLEIHEMLTGWEDWAESTQRGQFGNWQPRKFYRGSPVEIWEQWTNQWKAPKRITGSPYEGGPLGVLSYDLNRVFDRIPTIATDDLDLPYYIFYLPKSVLRYDHQNQTVHAIRWLYPNLKTRKRDPEQVWHEELAPLKMLPKVWENACRKVHAGIGEIPKTPLEESSSEKPSLDLEEYSDAVRKIQQYIAEGESLQVNIALRQSEKTDIPGWKLYEALRRVNPSPYMGLWRHPEFELICGSPELLVKKQKNHVACRPIGGTRPRGLTPEEDQALSEELQQHPKDHVEHQILADVICEDLKKICDPGSVYVSKSMVQERYSHVIHLVSQVEGEWNQEGSSWNLIPALFPGGSISGAPKTRTMQIIEELEPVRRYYYTGSMGWFDFSGDMKWNILIRTLLLKDQIAHVYAGAGVITESVPEKEYLECLQKGKALWKARSLAESWEQSAQSETE